MLFRSLFPQAITCLIPAQDLNPDLNLLQTSFLYFIFRHEVGFQENTQKWEINGGGMFYYVHVYITLRSV